METKSGRTTFVQLGDLLQSASERCVEVGATLNRAAKPHDEMRRAGYEKIARKERELAAELTRFANTAPANLVDTRYQFTPPAAFRRTSGNADEALVELEEVNYQLTRNLYDLSRNTPPPELAESLYELSRKVDSIGRGISMTCITLRDL